MYKQVKLVPLTESVRAAKPLDLDAEDVLADEKRYSG